MWFCLLGLYRSLLTYIDLVAPGLTGRFRSQVHRASGVHRAQVAPLPPNMKKDSGEERRGVRRSVADRIFSVAGRVKTLPRDQVPWSRKDL